MLNFYGLRLVSEVTGEVARWPGIWRDRYDNLNWSGHNNLRISTLSTPSGGCVRCFVSCVSCDVVCVR
jgi:hypothetical protein